MRRVPHAVVGFDRTTGKDGEQTDVRRHLASEHGLVSVVPGTKR
jgi:hypothetical protein